MQNAGGYESQLDIITCEIEKEIGCIAELHGRLADKLVPVRIQHDPKSSTDDPQVAIDEEITSPLMTRLKRFHSMLEARRKEVDCLLEEIIL